MKTKLILASLAAAVLAAGAPARAIDPFTLGTKRDGSKIDKMGIESMRHPKAAGQDRLEKKMPAPQRTSQINPNPLEFFSGERDSYFGVQY